MNPTELVSLFGTDKADEIIAKKVNEKQEKAVTRKPKRVQMDAATCKKLCKSAGVEYREGYEERVLEYTITDETVDRYGDIVRAKGVDMMNYKKNPVILLMHNKGAFPVGNSIKQWHDATEKSVKSWGLFVDDEIDKTGIADTAFRLASSGFMPACSIGFMPLEYNRPNTKEERDALGLGEYGVEFTKSELLEWSVCPVPANPNALANGFDKSMINEKSINVMRNTDVFSDDLLAALENACADDPFEALMKAAEGEPEDDSPSDNDNTDDQTDQDAQEDADGTNEAGDDQSGDQSTEDLDDAENASDDDSADNGDNAEDSDAQGDGTSDNAQIDDEDKATKPQGAWKYCICESCGYYEDHKAGTPCKKCPECGKQMKGSDNKPKKKKDITKPGYDETEKQIRYRVRNPDQFLDGTFRTVTIKKDKPRVSSVMGKLKKDGKDGPMVVQNLMFPKDDGWTVAKAKKWVGEHKDEIKTIEEIIVELTKEESSLYFSLDNADTEGIVWTSATGTTYTWPGDQQKQFDDLNEKIDAIGKKLEQFEKFAQAVEDLRDITNELALLVPTPGNPNSHKSDDVDDSDEVAVAISNIHNELKGK